MERKVLTMKDVLFGNNNAAVIKRLSDRNFKANMKQNKVMVFSIMLVTAMIFTVCSVGLSFLENFNLMNLHLKGTQANGLLTDPTQEQAEALKQLDYLSSAGEQIYAGAIEAGDGKQISLTFYDNTEWEDHIRKSVDNIHGALPQAENEIMLSEDALLLLGISNPEIGMEIDVNVNGSGSLSKEHFTLTGWYKDYVALPRPGGGISGNVAAAALKGYPSDANAIVSRYFAEKHFITGLISFHTEQGMSDIDKRLQADLSISGSQSIILLDMQSETGAQGPYAVMGVIIAGMFIMLSGYLLIYNIAYISVTKDIHFYGVLKTLGATSPQLKRLVRRQILFFSRIGIPLGILSGSILSFAVVPVCLKTILSSGGLAEIMVYKASFHPLIYIFAVLFSLITVFISCGKPAKEAGKVSPVEAVRYTGIDRIAGKQYCRKHGTRLYAMALRNVFQNKKRAALVFLSLSLGLTVFLMVFTAFSHPDWELKAKIDMPYDYIMNNTTIAGLKESALIQPDDSFLQDLSSMKGIEEQEIVYGSICRLSGSEPVWAPYIQHKAEAMSIDPDKMAQNALTEINGVSSTLLTKIPLLAGNYDKDALSDFDNGNTVYLAPPRSGSVQESMVGSNITITDYYTGQTASYIIAGFFEGNVSVEKLKESQIDYISINSVYTEDLSSDYANYSIGKIYMSETGIRKLNSNPFIGQIFLNVTASMDRNINYQLKASLENRAGIMLMSKSESTRIYKDSLGSILLIGTIFSFLLLFTGIINFVNTITTAIYTRRYELTVLESIGMTKKQILAMLSYEGGIYAAFSILLLFAAGLPVTCLVLKLIQEQLFYMIFKVPVAMLLLIFTLIFAVCLVVPRYTFKQLAKDSISARFKTAE